MKDKKIKEKILDVLDGKSILKCPYCEHGVFLRKSFARVEIGTEDGVVTDSMVDGFEEYEYSCAKCGEYVEIEEIAGGL